MLQPSRHLVPAPAARGSRDLRPSNLAGRDRVFVLWSSEGRFVGSQRPAAQVSSSLITHNNDEA